MEIITREWLSSGRREPCRDQLDIFNTHWPNGAEVTLENARTALSLGLDIYWVIEWRLPIAYRKRYIKAIAPIREQYWKAIAPFLEQYEKAIAPSGEQYYRDIARVWVRTIQAYFESSQAKAKGGFRMFALRLLSFGWLMWFAGLFLYFIIRIDRYGSVTLIEPNRGILLMEMVALGAIIIISLILFLAEIKKAMEVNRKAVSPGNRRRFSKGGLK